MAMPKIPGTTGWVHADGSTMLGASSQDLDTSKLVNIPNNKF